MEETFLGSRKSFLLKLSQIDDKSIVKFHSLRHFLFPDQADLNNKSYVADIITSKENKYFSKYLTTKHFITIEAKSLTKLKEIQELALNMLESHEAYIIKGLGLSSVLNYLTNNYYGKLALKNDNLHYINSIDKRFHRTGLIEYNNNHPVYAKTISISDIPRELYSTVVSSLLSLDFELEVTTQVECTNKLKVMASITGQERTENNLPGLKSEAKAEAFANITELINENVDMIYYVSISLLIKAESQELLSEHMGLVRTILAQDNIGNNIDSSTNLAMWLNRHAGFNNKYTYFRMFSENIATLNSFENEPKGFLKSQWADQPITQFKTSTGNTYRFNLHRDERLKKDDTNMSAGHFCMVGGTGGGKTQFIVFRILANLIKMNNVRSFILDSKQGARFGVEALGGEYFSLKAGNKAIQLNPLHLADTEDNRAYLSNLILMMSGVDNKDSTNINQARRLVDTAYKIPKEHRTFNEIFTATSGSMKDGLSRWVETEEENGMYANIFNGSSDVLSSQIDSSFMVGWNLDEALKDEVLSAPLVSYIMQCITSSNVDSGNGTCLFVDEAPALFKNQQFREIIAVQYREARKNNGVVGIALQEPSVLEDPEVAKAILSNTTTFFFMPNKTAKWEQYSMFNLTEDEFLMITEPENYSNLSRPLLILKRYNDKPNETVLVEADAVEYYGEDFLKYMQSGSESLKKLVQLKERFKDQWRENL